ncbi:MAG: putative ABC transporter permease [Clostridia bacterium]|nr:putative ABC transporter permease [Clostridia bacterium]
MMKQTPPRKASFKGKIKYAGVFWLFMIGSVLGFVLEGIWHAVRWGGWESHSAVVWGPFCIIYGIAAVVLYLASFYLQDKGIISQFLICGAVGSAIEWASAVFQERAFGSYSWDYSDQTFQLDGKVSLFMTCLWGALGVLFIKLLFPFLEKNLPRMIGGGWNIACTCLSVFMAINLLLTTFAVLRWGERTESIPASSNFEVYLDERYNDDKMSEIFPNMNFRE